MRLSAQRPSLLDPSPERPLGARFSPPPAPGTAAQWGRRMRRNLPGAAAEPPRRPAQAPGPGTCGSPVPAAARLRGAAGLSALRPGFPAALPRAPRRGGGWPAARSPASAGRARPPAAHTDPAPRTYGVRLRRGERVPPGGPWRFRTRQARRAAPHSTAQKMDAGGWALPAGPPPARALAAARPPGGRPDPPPRGGRCRGLAAPRTRPREGGGGTRAPQTSPSGRRPPPPPSPGKTVPIPRKDTRLGVSRQRAGRARTRPGPAAGFPAPPRSPDGARALRV